MRDVLNVYSLHEKKKKRVKETAKEIKPEGLLTGVLGLKPPPLWLEMIEGLANGLPLKLLLIGLISEFLELGFVGLLGIGERESNFLLAALDSLAKVLIMG